MADRLIQLNLTPPPQEEGLLPAPGVLLHLRCSSTWGVSSQQLVGLLPATSEPAVLLSWAGLQIAF